MGAGNVVHGEAGRRHHDRGSQVGLAHDEKRHAADDEGRHRHHLEAPIGRMLRGAPLINEHQESLLLGEGESWASQVQKGIVETGWRMQAPRSSGHASGGTAWRKGTPAKGKDGRLP